MRVLLSALFGCALMMGCATPTPKKPSPYHYPEPSPLCCAQRKDQR